MRFLLWFIFLLLLDLDLAFSKPHSISWAEIQKLKKGEVTVYWFPNDPFGYKDASGQMKGIEVEIIKSFQKYLYDHHKINLSVRWTEEKTFKDVLSHLKNDSSSNDFGIAGFSFSAERRAFMKFSPSYMEDIAVLVSTQDIPIVRSTEDLKKYFEGATALTPQGTLLEKELIQLRDKYQLHFNIEYTTNHELLKVIRNRKKAIGFLNLPIYLMDLKKGLTKLNRQNYLTKRYEGRGIGLTKTSDWDEPLKEYFASTQFKQNIELIMGHYFNIDLFHFIETFSPENEVGLLTEEKDLQRLQLQLQQVEIRDKNEKQVYLIAIISIVSILLLVIAFLFKKQRETNHLLQEQKAEIETQSEHIKAINNNLELMILERTRQLENKNKALEEYAFITAHKLRGPLTSIMGLVMLTEKIKLPEEDKIIISHLHQSAKQLDEIVHSAMNAIDKSDSLKQDKSA